MRRFREGQGGRQNHGEQNHEGGARDGSGSFDKMMGDRMMGNGEGGEVVRVGDDFGGRSGTNRS